MCGECPRHSRGVEAGRQNEQWEGAGEWWASLPLEGQGHPDLEFEALPLALRGMGLEASGSPLPPDGAPFSVPSDQCPTLLLENATSLLCVGVWGNKANKALCKLLLDRNLAITTSYKYTHVLKQKVQWI